MTAIRKGHANSSILEHCGKQENLMGKSQRQLNKERPQTASDDEKRRNKVMLTMQGGERRTGSLTGSLTTTLYNGCFAAQMMIGGTR